MKIYNPYTRGCIEYPLYFEPEKYHYIIRHETPFTDRYGEWAVYHIETGDVIYIPYGSNRCRNIYIVTSFYLDGTVSYPHGIYTVAISRFTTPKIDTAKNANYEDGFHSDDDAIDVVTDDDDDDLFDPYIID